MFIKIKFIHWEGNNSYAKITNVANRKENSVTEHLHGMML